MGKISWTSRHPTVYSACSCYSWAIAALSAASSDFTRKIQWCWLRGKSWNQWGGRVPVAAWGVGLLGRASWSCAVAFRGEQRQWEIKVSIGMPGLTWEASLICCTSSSLIDFGGQPTDWWEPQEWFLPLSPPGRQDKGIHTLNIPVGNTVHHNIIVWFSWMGKLAFHRGIASTLMACITRGRTAAGKTVGHCDAMERMKVNKEYRDWRKRRPGTTISHNSYFHFWKRKEEKNLWKVTLSLLHKSGWDRTYSSSYSTKQ